MKLTLRTREVIVSGQVLANSYKEILIIVPFTQVAATETVQRETRSSYADVVVYVDNENDESPYFDYDIYFSIIVENEDANYTLITVKITLIYCPVKITACVYRYMQQMLMVKALGN